MIPDKYLLQAQGIIYEIVGKKKVQVFLFGSAAKRTRFHDCDVGLLGAVSIRDVRTLQERFAQSTLPYKVDVVDFNRVSVGFKKNVFSGKVIWIKR